MKLHLILSLFTVVGAFAADSINKDAAKTPEQLRKGLKKRGLQSGDGGDSGGDSGTGGCFSAATTVEVQGKGFVKMDSLEIGDYVRAGKEGEFSRVFSFGHVDAAKDDTFVQIHSKGNDQPIELTPNHMIFVADKPVRAETVKVGDKLDQSIVTNVKTVKRTGVFAPITESGEINVNGVRASTYVAFVDNVLVDQHHMTHMFFAPHRILCGINFSWCEKETYTDGFSDYSNWAIQIYMKANSWSAPAKHAASLVALLILPTWYTAEQFSLSPLMSLAVLGYVVYKTNTKKTKSA